MPRFHEGRPTCDRAEVAVEVGAETMKAIATVVRGTGYLALIVLSGWWAGGCGPNTIEEPTPTPEATPEGTPTFAPGLDVDQDGYGANEECDDTYDETYPGAEEVCDGRDNDCNGVVDDRDMDEDGYIALRCGGEDCDDDDDQINPAMAESCNGVDENCNGEVDEGAFITFYIDRDQDGYGDPKESEEACTAPTGYVTDNQDCRDQDPEVHPGQPELCNGLDDDCNGAIDDGLPITGYYPDADGDGFGDAASPAFETCDESPPGYVVDHQDCDDSRADAHPGATEVCNGMDDDCDGFVDQDDPEGVIGYSTFYRDRDGDGYGIDALTHEGCEAPAGYAAVSGDCNDDRSDIHPGAEETCDGLDNDCDGERDDSYERTTYYLDQDQDGFGGAEVLACSTLDDPASAGLVLDRGDCDDASPIAHPGAPDTAGDGIDSDCGGADGEDPHVGLSDTSQSTIQAALLAASPGATVWVGPGRYQESEIDFGGKAVQLRSTGGAERTTIDADGAGTVLLFQTGEGPDTVLDGFTIQGGAGIEGGGLYMFYADPTVAHCNVQENQAEYGGGLFLFASSPDLSHVTAARNEATTAGGGLYLRGASPRIADLSATDNLTLGQGGGLYLRASSPSITDFRVAGNDADLGGGIYLGADAAPTLAQGQIIDNTAGRGAGFHADSATPEFVNCYIAANSATGDGGGGYLKATDATFLLVIVEQNTAANFGGGLALNAADPVMTNVVIAQNTAPHGAGLHVSGSSPSIRNGLIIENEAEGDGGGIYLVEAASAPLIENTIIAYNSVDNLFDHPQYSSTPSLAYTILYNPAGTSNHNLDAPGTTVWDLEPGFLEYDPEGRPSNWHLTIGGNAVDRGAPDTLDLDGSPADLGAFGGPDGGAWDLDRDGLPTYFWPGRLEDAPPGFDPEAWDSDDELAGGM